MTDKQLLHFVLDVLKSYQRNAPMMSGAVASVITHVELALQRPVKCPVCGREREN